MTLIIFASIMCQTQEDVMCQTQENIMYQNLKHITCKTRRVSR